MHWSPFCFGVTYAIALLVSEDLAGFLEDDLSLSNINQVRDVKLKPKQQAPWCKPVKNLEKVPCKAPNSTKKGAQYRIQQPRAAM